MGAGAQRKVIFRGIQMGFEASERKRTLSAHQGDNDLVIFVPFTYRACV